MLMVNMTKLETNHKGKRRKDAVENDYINTNDISNYNSIQNVKYKKLT